MAYLSCASLNTMFLLVLKQSNMEVFYDKSGKRLRVIAP